MTDLPSDLIQLAVFGRAGTGKRSRRKAVLCVPRTLQPEKRFLIDVANLVRPVPLHTLEGTSDILDPFGADYAFVFQTLSMT